MSTFRFGIVRAQTKYKAAFVFDEHRTEVALATFPTRVPKPINLVG